jgi:YHS domain-containing protein
MRSWSSSNATRLPRSFQSLAMTTSPRAAATAVYQGTTYYFCTLMCKRAFEQAPEKYIGKK